MFNAKRIETIRGKIQTSTLLSDHEKSDWLNLLELMNDKQLGELEEILASDPLVATTLTTTSPLKPPAIPVTPTSTPTPASLAEVNYGAQQKLPPLSHIANIPTDVNMAHSAPPTPLSVRATPSPNLSSFGEQQSSQTPVPSKIIPPLPPVTTPTAAQTSSPQTTSAPKTEQSTLPRYTITQSEDLKQIDAKALRSHNFQSIFDVVKNAIEINGYFPVRQFIEASPLYTDYINAGKERLGEQVKTKSTLTQEEFEFITDLLRNMRFNRW